VGLDGGDAHEELAGGLVVAVTFGDDGAWVRKLAEELELRTAT
jgi:hypothetical protein